MYKEENKLQNDALKLEKEIANKEYKKLYVFIGEEKYLKQYYKELLVSSILTEEEKEMNYEIINKDNFDKTTIKGKIDTVPFFAPYRVILLDEIGVQQKPEMFDVLSNIPEGTIVICLEEKNKIANKNDTKDNDTNENENETASTNENISETENINVNEKSKKNSDFTLEKLCKNINQKDVCFINFDVASIDILKRRILDITKENSIKINNVAIDFLLQRCGKDAGNIENEVKKLCAYKINEKEITVEDIKLLCSPQIEEAVFDMISDIAGKRINGAMNQYKALIASGTVPKVIVATIAWQYMQIFEIKLALSNNLNKMQIINISKQKDYQVTKTIELANKISMKKIKEIIKLCKVVDQGFMKGEDNLEYLIYKIIG